MAAESEEAARREAACRLSAEEGSLVVVRDADVLDTWFSSALQPFAVFGWPQQVRRVVAVDVGVKHFLKDIWLVFLISFLKYS